MATEVFSLSFMWSSRQESLDHCVRLLSEFLGELRLIDKIFERWVKAGKHDISDSTVFDSKRLRQFLKEGMNREDVSHEIIPELGYSASFLAREGESFLTVRVNCGVYCRWNFNVVTIDFPAQDEAAERILQIDVLTRIAKAVIHVWQPDHGIITSYGCQELCSPATFESEAGWITYLSEKYNDITSIPEPATVETVGNGRLIFATRDRFSSGNPEHMKIVKVLTALLDAKFPGKKR